MDSKEGTLKSPPLEPGRLTSRDMASENGSCAEFVEWN